MEQKTSTMENDDMLGLKRFAPVVVRLGLAMVFVWFGLNQLTNTTEWLSFIPLWVTNLTGITANTFVLVNGAAEILLAILLAVGIQIRVVAGLLCIHMFMIVLDVGLNAVGVRDVGLMFGLLSVGFHGKDLYSFDK